MEPSSKTVLADSQKKILFRMRHFQISHHKRRGTNKEHEATSPTQNVQLENLIQNIYCLLRGHLGDFFFTFKPKVLKWNKSNFELQLADEFPSSLPAPRPSPGLASVQLCG